ncbi:MAG: hypothetical protein JJU20_05185 [Opitutales bacterium]|nr:hypothetical protein [Opitutales bacterium]
MLLKSYLLRLSQILALTAAVGYVLMAVTCYLQYLPEAGHRYLIYALPLWFWVIGSQLLIRSKDPELIAEVAKWLYPTGAILSIALSVWMAMELASTLEEPELRHLVVVFAGIGVAVFLTVRCMDIRWLRTRAEMEEIIKSKR